VGSLLSPKQVLLDAAEARTINDLESHVALLAPRSAPRVSHDPVLDVVFFAPANHIDRMIVRGTTILISKDARFVELEHHLSSFNCGGEGRDGQGGFHRIRTIRGNGIDVRAFNGGL